LCKQNKNKRYANEIKTKIREMRIKTSTLNKWKILRERGDVGALIEYTGYTQPPITKALNKGIASEELAKKIAEFYTEKKERQTQLA